MRLLTLALFLFPLILAHTATAGETRNFTPAFQSLDDELKQRFLAASAAARNPQAPDHIDTLIEVLRTAENDFSLQLGSRDLLRVAAELNPAYLAYFDPALSKGLQHYRPIETAARPQPSGYRRGFIVDAIAYASLCLATEVNYNTRYVSFLNKQQWPPQLENYAPVRFGLLLRMWHRQCISNATLADALKPLLPAVQRLLKSPGRAPGDVGSLLYLLAASGRLDLVPGDLLLQFARSQEIDGSWKSTEMNEPAVSAAQGLYILGAMLKKNGQQATNLEVYKAQRNKPNLPSPMPLQHAP